MSAAVPETLAIPKPERDGWWALVAAGLCLLLLRVTFASGPGGAWLLAASYLALGTASIRSGRLPSSPSGDRFGSSPRPRYQMVVLAGALTVGVGAFVVATAIDRQSIHPSVGGFGLGLTALASVAEEAFFRGFLFNRLVRFGSLVAVGVPAAAFALIHVGTYPSPAVWVALAAGLLFGWQRRVTGTWLAPAATHLAANLLAVAA